MLIDYLNESTGVILNAAMAIVLIIVTCIVVYLVWIFTHTNGYEDGDDNN